jgi:O-antigen/teichoic acid export membrane protein
MSLKARLLQAGLLTAGAYSVELVIRLVSSLILTRLLFPEAFGLVAAAGSINFGLALISDFGVRAAIIQNPNGDRDLFLRTAWSFQISRGIALWLTLGLICGIISLPIIHGMVPVESVFRNPTFPALTLALGLGLLIDGFESTAIPLNLRRLNYTPLIAIDLIGKLLPVPVTISLAWFYPSPWSLAGGALTAGIVRLILSHTVIPGPKMRWEWDKEFIKQIIHFGKWITVASIATFIGSQSDVILFGLLLPGSFVGVYFIARTLSDAVEGLIERLNSSLTLPALGEVLRQNPLNLKDRFYRFRLPIDLIATCTGGFLFVAGEQIVRILYDPRYAQAGSILEILGLGLAIYPLQLIRGAFTATGKTHIGAIGSALQALSAVASLLIGFKLAGAMGAVAGVTLSRAVPAIFLFFLGRRQNWSHGWRELRLLPLFLFGTLAGAIFVMLTERFGILHLFH